MDINHLEFDEEDQNKRSSSNVRISCQFTSNEMSKSNNKSKGKLATLRIKIRNQIYYMIKLTLYIYTL